jgi:hypothetical protein
VHVDGQLEMCTCGQCRALYHNVALYAQASRCLCPDAQLCWLAGCRVECARSRRTIESHEPVHRLSASLLTPRQLTRLSCPCRVPTRSPRRTSQTWIALAWSFALHHVVAPTLHSKSSYPANNSRPETEKATEVMPQTGSGIWKAFCQFLLARIENQKRS